METTYYYSVTEFVTTFGLDPGKNKAFINETVFKGPDLRQCRKEAFDWYYERLQGFETCGGYFLPFASPENFIRGKHSAFSLTLDLVEVYDGEEITHPLAGEDEEAMQESYEIEEEILRDLDNPSDDVSFL